MLINMKTLSITIKEVYSNSGRVPKYHNSCIVSYSNIRQILPILQPEFMHERKRGRTQLCFNKATNIHFIHLHEANYPMLFYRNI